MFVLSIIDLSYLVMRAMPSRDVISMITMAIDSEWSFPKVEREAPVVSSSPMAVSSEVGAGVPPIDVPIIG